MFVPCVSILNCTILTGIVLSISNLHPYSLWCWATVGHNFTHSDIYKQQLINFINSPASDSTRRLLEKGNVHPISVIRPQPETRLHATDGDTDDGSPQSISLNAGQEGSRQECACEAPPAYQPCDRGTAATARASIPPVFPGGPSMA